MRLDNIKLCAGPGFYQWVQSSSSSFVSVSAAKSSVLHRNFPYRRLMWNGRLYPRYVRLHSFVLFAHNQQIIERNCIRCVGLLMHFSAVSIYIGKISMSASVCFMGCVLAIVFVCLFLSKNIIHFVWKWDKRVFAWCRVCWNCACLASIHTMERAKSLIYMCCCDATWRCTIVLHITHCATRDCRAATRSQ